MNLRALLPLAVAILFAATPASAQEGGLLSPETGLMAWTLIVFGIVLFLLYRYVYPYILGAVEAREEQIRELLAAAARDRQEAQEALEKQNQQLEETRGRMQELVAEGRAAGERMRDELILEARRQAEELLTRAQRDVRQELDRALQELRGEAVEIAIATASKLVERNLDEEDNRRLVRQYLADLEARGEAPVPAGV